MHKQYVGVLFPKRPYTCARAYPSILADKTTSEQERLSLSSLESLLAHEGHTT